MPSIFILSNPPFFLKSLWARRAHQNLKFLKFVEARRWCWWLSFQRAVDRCVVLLFQRVVDQLGLKDGADAGVGPRLCTQLYNMFDKNFHNREREACLCLIMSFTHILRDPRLWQWSCYSRDSGSISLLSSSSIRGVKEISFYKPSFQASL